MGRKKLPDAHGDTLSLRVSDETSRRLATAIADKNVTRSAVIRYVLEDISEATLANAATTLQQESILALRDASLGELRTKRGAAQRLIAWIDAELAARATAARSD